MSSTVYGYTNLLATPLGEILDILRSMDASHLDRQSVERLFGTGRRRALIGRIEEAAASGAYRW